MVTTYLHNCTEQRLFILEPNFRAIKYSLGAKPKMRYSYTAVKLTPPNAKLNGCILPQAKK